ncbi:hypothetical protein A3A95_04090 [Candidatus Nomurabacteria bacterium RIFCSPLOWO2_01_FULL_39_18]|uniref:Uncharacterized protein n=1 Tax=Candidatus Nomurabacteria bacterium RIFCSPHIGHO2_01_FULL_40_24b TaxID=1801739 RepID=A0A1F6V683_9BACT|nr:MAG: hypothetical protein A2647_04430 [Candidatus Nomurabacteria bacterium RIFCSPHIGHO2_01_FULL_40_24b]OGI89281.1 MAG: hypothetical protein A3A95_04090 [Candidatus Nomurabacteria bacterium RIFCSPLOWO2_01_FULL_39_18]
MENKQKVIIALIVSAFLIVMAISYAGKKSEENITSPPIAVNSNFSEISQADQEKIREIMLGVMQDTIQVTPAVKQEFISIFKKYNATNEEIEDFGMYGPALAVNYQKMFFTDALQSVQSSSSVKSQERADYEVELLQKGLITQERIDQNDAEMYKIANHQLSSNGQVLVIEDIKQTLNGIDIVGGRIKSLFSR